MDKKVIEKKDWVSSFVLTGEPKISEDYTFKIDERSEKSNWIYNSMNLGVWCGERAGTVYSEIMGGYSEVNNNVIYAHGKNENGSDDFNTQIIVDWDDRFDEELLEKIGDLSFITVGLEQTSKGQTFYKKFLSAYDAIAYVKKYLTENMVITVRGNLKYSSYNDRVQVRKNITYIGLAIDSNTKKPVTNDKYKAAFTQSILIDKDSANLKNIDKNKSVMYVDARVLDYAKEIDGVEVKGQYPYNKQFEFPLDLTNGNLCKTIYEKVFKVKKGITQITFEGEFIEGGAVVAATLDDIPQDIKDLIGVVYTEEEALASCTANSNRERRMVLKKPMIRMVGDEENKVPVIQKFEERYTEEDLVLDYLHKDDESVDKQHESESVDDSMDWLQNL